jgi:RNA polymerase sigma factor (sigma-70 family)
MRATVHVPRRSRGPYRPRPPRVLRPLRLGPPARVRPLDAAGQRRVRTFCTLAYRIAWQYARQARDVPPEELLGEALYGLTYAASMFEEHRGVPFAAYATLVVRHRLMRAILEWRREKWIRPLPAKRKTDEPWDVENPHSPDLCTEASARDMCERIRSTLPARWYDVLQLHYGKGLSFEEVGQQLGISRQRARQLLDKAVRHTRKEFPEWIHRAGIRT